MHSIESSISYRQTPSLKFLPLTACSGAYADVLKAHDTLSGEAVAVKVVSRFACQQYAALMQKEVAVMQRIDRHPHLLSLREVFCSEHHMYIITGASLWRVELT